MSSAPALLVARLVQTITEDTPQHSATGRLGHAVAASAEYWARCALVNGHRPPRHQTKREVLVQLAKEATLEMAMVARLRGEGGFFETLAIGSERAGLGLDHDAWLIVQEAHREMVAEAERIKGAA